MCVAIATAVCHAIVPAGVEMWLFTVMHGQMHVSGDSDKGGLAPNLMLSDLKSQNHYLLPLPVPQ